MRNGYIVDVLTSVDIQQIIKIGGKVVGISKGVIYSKKCKISSFGKVIEKLFASRQKIETKETI